MNPFDDILATMTDRIICDLKCAGIEPDADAIAVLISKELLPRIREIAACQIEVMSAIESAAVAP
ncbi:MAG: hypothetical protein WB559_08860 [Candidatus Acidiferrales bacterium]